MGLEPKTDSLRARRATHCYNILDSNEECRLKKTPRLYILVYSSIAVTVLLTVIFCNYTHYRFSKQQRIII